MTRSIVAECATAPSVAQLAELLTLRLKQLFQAELVVWDRFTRDGRPIAFRLSDDLGDVHTRLRPAFLAHFADHPFARDLPEIHRTGRVIVLSDRISDRAFRRTGLWNEVYIHLRARYQLAFGGLLDAASTWCFGVNRLTRDFGPRERELARFLQPHLAAAFSDASHRERAARAGRMTTAAFASRDAAYFIIDVEGNLLEASDAATKFFATLRPGPGAATGRLTHFPHLASEFQALASQVRGLSARSPSSPWIFASIGAAPVLALRVDATDTILVLLQEEDGAGATRPTAALSKREAEVRRWIARGKSNAEIAALLGISVRTVAKHCENLFAKLGVDNRVAAALLTRHEIS